MEAGGEPGTPTPEASSELRGALLTPPEREDSITRLRLGIVPVRGTHTSLVQASQVGLSFSTQGDGAPGVERLSRFPAFIFSLCVCRNLGTSIRLASLTRLRQRCEGNPFFLTFHFILE